MTAWHVVAWKCQANEMMNLQHFKLEAQFLFFTTGRADSKFKCPQYKICRLQLEQLISKVLCIRDLAFGSLGRYVSLQ